MKKLTKIRFQTLELLSQGKMITIDKTNEARIDEKPVASVTRYFLTQNRLVSRLDKGRKVESLGNGYIISEKGLKVFQDNW